jgi:protease-4
MNNKAEEVYDSQVLINKMLLDFIRQDKRRRFWHWILRAVVALLILFLFYLIFSSKSDTPSPKDSPHVGIIDIKGTIFEDQSASADNLMKSLEKAYKNKNMKAIILRIDSPGGSPVQADYMYNAIRYFQKQFPQRKVYAVCVDACASAAYYVACAADEIYASPSSLVGSIGVLYNGFGFVDTIQKLGVQRRLYTSGNNKGFLDQFSPVNPEQEKLLVEMLNIIHQQFIEKVKEGRGKRLVIGPDTFSGLFWTGAQAKERGLIDGFASPGQLSREVIKVDKLVDYTHKENMLDRISKNFGSAMANQLPKALGLKEGFR